MRLNLNCSVCTPALLPRAASLLVALVHAGFVAYLTATWFVDQWGFPTMIWIRF